MEELETIEGVEWGENIFLTKMEEVSGDINNILKGICPNCGNPMCWAHCSTCG